MTLDKLVVNSQTFTYDNVDALPEYVKSNVNSPVCMKQSDDVTIFFTARNPLSNFHECSFTVGDHRYVCVEQYMSQQKAILFGTPVIANQIMNMTDPKLMKQTVRRLKGYDDTVWESNAADFLQTALKAKFCQNDKLREALLATNDTTIGEASSSDLLFGIGMSLTNKHSMDKTKWCGANLHGVSLMAVRDAIKNN